jgi:hypothetical protein
VSPVLAFTQPQLDASVVLLAAGFLVGVFGHIIGSRPLILAGIVIVGAFSVYFTFAVAHVS